ncbi:MAG: glycosyltransferase [Chloroflexota bacterium]
MRVLMYVSSQRWLGGIGNQSALLARELVGMGHEVTVIGFGGPISTDVGPHVALPRRIPIRGGTVRFRPFEFGYHTVAPAGNYLFALPRIIRWCADPVIERLLRIAFPDNPGGHGSQFFRRISEVVNGLTGSFNTTSHEAAFLSRLLLETDGDDIAQIIRIRESCAPDVEYVCDLSLVPLIGKLPVRRSPLVAAAQGFELVWRRGVPLLPAIRKVRDRISLVVSASEANIADNLVPIWDRIGGPIRTEVVPYGVGDDPDWQMPVTEARDWVASHFRETGLASGWANGSDDGDTPFTVAWLSRLDVEKGPDLALHAMACLRDRGISAVLWLVGQEMPGSTLGALIRQKVRWLDLEDRVFVVTSAKTSRAKAAFLRGADAFLATFIRSEPFGLVLSEAMACGLPIVAPDQGGSGEVLRASGLGALAYPANDSGAIADRLERLATDNAFRQEASKRSRASFNDRFNAKAMGLAFASTFMDVANMGT